MALRGTRGIFGVLGAGAVRGAVLVTLMLAPRGSHAAFTPLPCSQTGWSNSIPTVIGGTRFDRSNQDWNMYSNNTGFGLGLFMNPNVVSINLHTNGFATEPNFDYLQINGQNNLLLFTGAVSAGWYSLPVLHGNSTVQTNINPFWETDSSVTGTPPLFDTAQFICQAPQAPINSLFFSSATFYAEGLLLGQGDVVYFSFSQPANTPVLLSLNTLSAPAGEDFDLYVSTTTALPDDSSFTWRAYTSWPNEFLQIPSVTTSRTLFVGVHSFAGGGHFSLRIMNQGVNPATKRLKVCTPGYKVDVFSTAYTQLAHSLQNTSLRMLSASNGNLWISGYDIYQSNACAGHEWCTDCDGSCQICLSSTTVGDSCSTGRSHSPPSVTRIADINCPAYAATKDIRENAFTWAHEWGHSVMSFADEYAAGGSFCGHSVMNGPNNTHFWCNANTHCKDGLITLPAGDSRCNSGQDNWSKAPASWARPLNLSSEPDTELFNNWNQPAMDAVTVVVH
jgi:hypothetical protein